MDFKRVYFKGKSLYKKNHVILAKIYRMICKVVFSCDIPFQTDIDETVHFCHNGFGIVVNPNTIIRGGVCIQHGVTLGEIDRSHDAPIIEENVFIGARAMVLGKVTVGKGALIGAGAVVIKDVPENCTVVGVPARIIEKKE